MTQNNKSPMKTVEVVAAYIKEKGKFLICQRPENKECALLWEFVGGKVENGETKEQALIRECKEELDIEVSVGDVFTQVDHAYPNKLVRLTIFCCAIEKGQPQKLEHPDIRWITAEEIPDYEFCPADTEILQKIQEEERQLQDKKHQLRNLLDRAMFLAIAAHKGQEDIAQEPYIFHPLRVMLSCKTEEERICAVLHDVIEDTPMTVDDLMAEGFSDTVVQAIDALSRKSGESYSEFITRILDNELACRVKLADLADNMDLSRIQQPDEEDYQRLKKYEKAKLRIEQRLGII